MHKDNPKRTRLIWLFGSLTLPGTDFVSRCVGICLVLLAMAVVIGVVGVFLLPAIP